MFCPRCGTKVTTSGARFCYECGSDISGAAAGDRQERDAGAQQEHGAEEGTRDRQGYQDWRGSFGGPSFVRAGRHMPPMGWKGGGLPTLLSAAGALMLLLLAIPILAGIALVTVFMGVALLATLIKLAPVILIGVLVYAVLARRRAPHPRW